MTSSKEKSRQRNSKLKKVQSKIKVSINGCVPGKVDTNGDTSTRASKDLHLQIKSDNEKNKQSSLCNERKEVAVSPKKGATKDNRAVLPKDSISTKSHASLSSSGGSNCFPQKRRSFHELVLYSIITAAKPFSTKGLVNMTRSSEAQIQYLMLSLVDKGLVKRKEFGKNGGKVLFWVNIGARDLFKAAGISMVTSDIKETAMKQFEMLQEDYYRKSKLADNLLSEPTNNEVDVQIQNSSEYLCLIKGKVSDAEAQHLKTISEYSLRNKKSFSQMEKELCPISMKKRINATLCEWKSRKNKCMDFVDNISDAMEKKRKDVLKLLDVETDSSAGISLLPAFREL